MGRPRSSSSLRCRERDADRRTHDHHPHDIRQEMAHDQAPVPSADAARRRDEVSGLERKNLAADHAGTDLQ